MTSLDSTGSAASLLSRGDLIAARGAVEVKEAAEISLVSKRQEAMPAAVPSGQTRVLMLAADFTTPYRVLRCAHASGAEIYVLGNAGARALRFSRYCRRVIISDRIIHGARDEALALEINNLVRELGITLVLPADAPSIRALIASRDLIEAPCFPMPSLEQFDALNSKWSFAQLCQELGIRHPVTRLLPDADAVAREITADGLGYPLIIKPLDRCAGAGVIVLDGIDTGGRLSTINYKPLLVQKFIRGEDIGASVYTRAGKIEAFITHSLQRGVYATFHNDNLHADIAKIASRLNLDGVYNFDMILAPDQSIYFLECNPRFFYKINLSMIAGINFVGCGLTGSGSTGMGFIPSGVQVRFPKALLRSLFLAGRCTKRDWALAAYLLSDPLPYLMEKLSLTV